AAPSETGLRNADDGVFLVDQFQCLADHGRVSVEVPQPEFIAQHDDRLRLLPEGGIGWAEVASEQRCEAQHWKCASGEVIAGHIFGNIVPGDSQVPLVDRRKAFDGMSFFELMHLRACETGKAK